MTKPKEKLGAFDVRCTQDSAGCWGWVIDGVQWRWREGAGLNVTIKLPSVDEQALVFCATLKDATMFAQGYMSGWYGRESWTRTEQRKADKTGK
jgi:hypothetical protein